MNQIQKIEFARDNADTFSFADPAWRQFPPKKHAELKLASNELWANNTTKYGALVLRRANKYPEFPIGQSGLNYLNDAVQTGKIAKGLVVLADWEGAQRVAIKILPVGEVVEAFKGIVPREGPYGHYFWMRADGTAYDPDAMPF
jgi:hypothetical protein